ncbi:MAG: hypothetical protein L3J79_06610, partial [Candidatus Marinimicrobia bacterium]|nr:hypothetical protein [Candidatus Neomarinimicrobiota bacterium]
VKGPQHKKKRLRGLQAEGMKYQRAVQRYLKRELTRLEVKGKFRCDKWLAFLDANLSGYAQPDCWFETVDVVFCFEIKRSATPAAWSQLELLYRPLLKMLFNKPVVTIQVCKFLRLKHPTSTLSDILHHASAERFLIHWNPDIDRD